MYEITDSFRSAMNDFVIKPVLRGSIGGKAFTQDDILQDSFRCCNQCIAVNDARLGGVFVGELRMTLLDSIANVRGDWVGKVIDCDFGLWTETGEEYIPCPSKFYTVYSADWTEQGLKIVAYDNMIKLDKTFDGEQTSGTPYAWLQFIARRTGIVIGNTESEVNAMPNGTQVIGIDSSDNISTYRDLASYLSAVLSGYATINRRGELVIKQFNGTVVNTIDPDSRFAGCSFSDYTTKYTGLSVVNNADAKVEYYHVNPDDGLTMKMGSNPFLQLGVNQEQIRLNILNELSSYKYVPFKATLLGCCAYDLGDLIRFTGGIAVDSVGCIMAFEFGLNSYSIACYGDNPALENVQTKTDKNISGITKSKASESLAVATLTNINNVGITEDWKEIGSVMFAVAKKQTVMFHAVAKENIATGGTVRYKYVLNDDPIDFIHEVHVDEGIDTATLFIPFVVEADVFNTFRVYVESDDAAGTIDTLNMRGAVLGVGMSFSEWDGTLSFFDTFSLRLAGKTAVNFVDGDVIINQLTPDRSTVSDVFSLSTRRKMSVAFDDDMRITLKEKTFRRITEDGSIRMTEDNCYRIT